MIFLGEKYIIIYLLGINFISVIVCVLDKVRAKKGAYRIKDSTLFGLAFLGGGVGLYITMRLIRHKTLHKSFMIGVPVIIIFEALFAVVFYLIGC